MLAATTILDRELGTLRHLGALARMSPVLPVRAGRAVEGGSRVSWAGVDGVLVQGWLPWDLVGGGRVVRAVELAERAATAQADGLDRWSLHGLTRVEGGSELLDVSTWRCVLPGVDGLLGLSLALLSGIAGSGSSGGGAAEPGGPTGSVAIPDCVWATLGRHPVLPSTGPLQVVSSRGRIGLRSAKTSVIAPRRVRP
jgi:hypothetical protein